MERPIIRKVNSISNKQGAREKATGKKNRQGNNGQENMNGRGIDKEGRRVQNSLKQWRCSSK